MSGSIVIDEEVAGGGISCCGPVCPSIERYRRGYAAFLYGQSRSAHRPTPPAELRRRRAGDRLGAAGLARGTGRSRRSAVGRRHSLVLGRAAVSRHARDHQKRPRQRKPGRGGGLRLGLHGLPGRRAGLRKGVRGNWLGLPARRAGDKAPRRPRRLDPHEPAATGAAATALEPGRARATASWKLQRTSRGRWRQNGTAHDAPSTRGPQSPALNRACALQEQLLAMASACVRLRAFSFPMRLAVPDRQCRTLLAARPRQRGSSRRSESRLAAGSSEPCTRWAFGRPTARQRERCATGQLQHRQGDAHRCGAGSVGAPKRASPHPCDRCRATAPRRSRQLQPCRPERSPGPLRSLALHPHDCRCRAPDMQRRKPSRLGSPQ